VSLSLLNAVINAVNDKLSGVDTMDEKEFLQVIASADGSDPTSSKTMAVYLLFFFSFFPQNSFYIYIYIYI
jgi:hypothetical protein